MVNSNDYQRALRLIDKSENVLITSHTRPDGDACGSVAAISDALEAMGKTVKSLMLSSVPQWYEFLLTGNADILGQTVREQELMEGRLGQFDLIIIVDTNSYSQLPKFEEYLKQSDTSVLIIDHHVTSDGLGEVEIIDSSAAATGLIVFDLFKFAGWTITPKIAEALFVAASTDTGWFQFSNTDSRTLRTCAELIDRGVNPTQIYADIYQNFSYARFKLMTAMLDTLELHLDNRYACVQITQSDMEQAGAEYSDTENLINECHRMGFVKVSAIFIELKDGRIRCSLRSKGAVDVSRIAAKFGGGGHKMAAGTFLPAPLENAKQLILNEFAAQMK